MEGYLGSDKRKEVTMNNIVLLERLQEFMEYEARSGSMDFGCITPMYVYRSWGGTVSIEDIEAGLTEIRKNGFME